MVSSASLDFNAANDTATDLTNVVLPNLSTSTKTVTDLNAGDANPGDTLRYTITLRETGGVTAPGVRVTDDIPANVNSFTVVTLPAGAVNNSTGAGTGDNSTGLLDISNITVPANGTVIVVFDVRVANSPPGATIDNTATVINTFGAGATPAAPQVVVSQSQIPASGDKVLYLRSGLQLSRTPAPTAPPAITIVEGNSQTWTLTPALATNLSLPAGNAPVQLYFTRTGNGTYADRSGDVDREWRHYARHAATHLYAQRHDPDTADLYGSDRRGDQSSGRCNDRAAGDQQHHGQRQSRRLVYPANSAAQRSNVSFNSNTVVDVTAC